jgi:hypothetical protein
MVAVYRFEGSMPIGGAEGNFCVLGADPSSGGNGKVIGDEATSVQGGRLVSHRPHPTPTMAEMNPDSPLDLDAMEQDLSDVEKALERLDNNSYWTDEATGAPIDASYLAEHPTARRNPAQS